MGALLRNMVVVVVVDDGVRAPANDRLERGCDNRD